MSIVCLICVPTNIVTIFEHHSQIVQIIRYNQFLLFSHFICWLRLFYLKVLYYYGEILAYW